MNIVHLGIGGAVARQPAAWVQSRPVIHVLITFLSPWQWNGAHRRCTWGVTAIRLRIYSLQAHHHRGGPLSQVTGSRPIPRVVLPAWLARSSVPVGFWGTRLVRPLASLKCSLCQLERLLCCSCICSPQGRTRCSHYLAETNFAGSHLPTFRA